MRVRRQVCGIPRPRDFRGGSGHGQAEDPRGGRLAAFLDLLGYYRQVIKDFGAITSPLTKLVRKEGFR
jgi:hypothetical protein